MMAYLRRKGKLLRFRTKLLILLLCLSLGPILLMRTTGMGAMKKMLASFIPQAREFLISNHETHLQSMVELYSFANMIGGEALELLLTKQAHLVQHALAGRPIDRNDPLFATNQQDYEGGQKAMALDKSDYYRLTRQGEKKDLPVDLKKSVVFKLEGARESGLEKDQKLLSGLDPAFQRITKIMGPMVLWRFTAMQNGLLSVFPKVDHLPALYDPRTTHWYRQAFEKNQMVWSLAQVDPLTRRSVLYLALPVKRPDGSTAGVTSLVVPVSVVLDRKEISNQVPPKTQIIMAYYGGCEECGPKAGLDAEQAATKDRVWIIARRSSDEKRRWGWRRIQEPQQLTSMHDIPFKAMLMDLRAGRSGSQRMEYEGKDCLWVYGPMNGLTFTLFITPYSEVLNPVNLIEQSVVKQISELMRWVLAMGLGVMLAVVVAAFFFSRTVTRPISQLAEASRSLGEGDFDARVEIKTCDEFKQIGQAFNDLGPRLKENYQLRQALALAMEVQQRLLPQSQPKVPGLDIFGKSVYCDETGGDYYDFISGAGAGEDGTMVVVGDVTGHGLPAALLMASARAFLRQRISMPGSLSNILADVNRQLVLDVYQTGRFMTLLACRFEADAKSMAWARAEA